MAPVLRESIDLAAALRRIEQTFGRKA